MHRSIYSLLSLVLCLFVAQVQAEERNFYIGGSVGISTYDQEDNIRAALMRPSEDDPVVTETSGFTIAEFDEAALAFKGFAGITLNEYFGGEVGYFNSDYDVTYSANGQTRDGDLTGFTYAGFGRYPINQVFDVFVKAGGATWELESEDNRLDDDGTNFLLGAGVEYEFGNELGIRLEYERIFISGEDIALYTVGIEYDFPF